jgi:hypothetical protein
LNTYPHSVTWSYYSVPFPEFRSGELAVGLIIKHYRRYIKYFIVSKTNSKKDGLTKNHKYAIYRHGDLALFLNDYLELVVLNDSLKDYNNKYWKIVKTK